MVNILFIGGAGFIGSNIIKKMLRTTNDYQIFVVEPTFANLSKLDGLQVKIISGDLSNLDTIRLLLDTYEINIVVHLVATIIPESDFTDYKREFQNIIFPTIEVMQICAEKHIRFIYFSSGGTIYGNRTDTLKFAETDPMQPISYYGWSKQIMENSVLYVHRTLGLEYLIVRPSNPYGHGQNIYAKQGLIAVAIGKILSGEPIKVWGNGSNIRDYIYIDDLSEIICQLIIKNVVNTTLNVGSGVGTSVNEIIRLLQNIVKEDVKIEYFPARGVDVANMILDITELHKYVEPNITTLYHGITNFYHGIRKELNLGNGEKD